MMKTGSAKIYIQVDSSEQHQQENTRSSSRKSLKVLQQVSADKENIIGRPSKSGKLNENEMTEKIEIKKKKCSHKSVQTVQETPKITAEDLTSESKPSENYWEILAEKRRQALEETLEENRRLHEQLEILQEENKTYKEMLAESKNLVAVLTEMLEEAEGNTVDQGTETSENLSHVSQ